MPRVLGALIGAACLLLISGIVDDSVRAQSPSKETFTFYASGPSLGSVTPSRLRMYQPLYLLDLCRQVQAGTLDRQAVAPLVGGDAILSALLAMNLDALYERLTAPPEIGAPPPPSLWQRILTNDGTAPLPPLDAPAPLVFRDVPPGDSPSQVLQVMSPLDGTLRASLPADSPFRIVSIRTYDGLIVPAPATGGAAGNAEASPRGRALLRRAREQFSPSPQFERLALAGSRPGRAGR